VHANKIIVWYNRREPQENKMKKFLIQFRYSRYDRWNPKLKPGQRTIKARDREEAEAKLSYMLDREGKGVYDIICTHKEQDA